MENESQGQGSVVTETPVVPVAPVVTDTPKTEVTPGLKFDQKDIDENKYVAALSYIWLLFLVPLLAKKESPFAQFHAKQGMVLCIASIILSFIPFFGWLANIALFVVVIIALIKTLSGQAWEIPLVKDAVKKINL